MKRLALIGIVLAASVALCYPATAHAEPFFVYSVVDPPYGVVVFWPQSDEPTAALTLRASGYFPPSQTVDVLHEITIDVATQQIGPGSQSFYMDQDGLEGYPALLFEAEWETDPVSVAASPFTISNPAYDDGSWEPADAVGVLVAFLLVAEFLRRLVLWFA